MLKRFKSWFDTDNNTRVQLLNRQSYWLSHPDFHLEWSFMFDHKHRFANILPEIWKTIQQNRTGYLHTTSGDYFYITLFPKHEVLKTLNKLNGTYPSPTLNEERTEPSWVLLSYTPSRQFSDYLLKQKTIDLFILLILLLLTGLSCWRYSKIVSLKKQWQSLTNLLFHGIEQSPSAVIITNKQGIIEYVNEKFSELSGYTTKEVIGENPRLLKSGNKYSDDYKALWHTISSGQNWQGEFHNQRKNGDYFRADAKISPVFDKNNALTHYICIQEDITEKHQLQTQLEHLASHDPLTNLLNRKALEQQLDADIERSQRYKSTLSLLILDIDHFKRVNDSYGHQVGDKVLRLLADTLSSLSRNIDYIARYGGEEFVVVLPETTETQAEVFANRVRRKIAKQSHTLGNGTVLNITVSIGVSSFPQHATNQDALIKAADEAMYLAKESGRNRTIVAKL